MKRRILNVEVDMDESSILRLEVKDHSNRDSEVVICCSNIFLKGRASNQIVTIFSNNQNLNGNCWNHVHSLGHIHFGFDYAWMTEYVSSTLSDNYYRMVTKVTREPITLYTGITH